MSNDVAEPDVRLDRWIDTRRTAIEDALERQLPTPPACPALIADAMRYSVRAGGKRLRPLLAHGRGGSGRGGRRAAAWRPTRPARARCPSRALSN